jgi:hypothetical protein
MPGAQLLTVILQVVSAVIIVAVLRVEATTDSTDGDRISNRAVIIAEDSDVISM